MHWLLYVKENGPLSVTAQTKILIDRLEIVGAKICWATLTAAGHKNVKLETFLPENLKRSANSADENAPPASIHQVLNLLNSVSVKDGRSKTR